MSVFHKIFEQVKAIGDGPEIAVPAVWLNKNTHSLQYLKAHCFFADRFAAIEKYLDHGLANLTPLPLIEKGKNNFTKTAITYNLLVRFFSAFDHNQDGKLGEGKTYLDNPDGIRESGTLLKTIALLPYLKNLGVNTVHLLPITPIGNDGRKGDMGSPYAIKNHFQIDPNIVDPFVPFSGEDQLAALIEACHGLKMRVVLEFILRTTAKDADWIAEHPDWYYWIKNEVKDFHAPEFTAEELKKIKKIPVGKGKYIEPKPEYRKIFTSPPNRNSIRNEKYFQGEISGRKVKVPSAFADWPPDDSQTPWTDVTYLKFYDDHSAGNFNYVAYNTIRYYDPKLENEENINPELWQTLTNLIPYFQKKYGIDGVMIDMGHALPISFKEKMISKAKTNNRRFAFWDEKFGEDKNISTDYAAIIGNSWYLSGRKNGHKKIIDKIKNIPRLNFFASAETHNSPRYGYNQSRKKKQMWLLLNLLPKGMPFIHQGFELNEWIPVNTGLNIDKKLKEKLQDVPLPLFNKTALDWQSPVNSIHFIRNLNSMRKKYPAVFSDQASTKVEYAVNSKIVVIRKTAGKQKFVFMFNFNHKRSELIQNNFISIKRYEILDMDTSSPLTEKNGAWKIARSGFAVAKIR